MNINIPSQLLAFCEYVDELDGLALLVGGCVRDAVLGFDNKDYDVEVYCLSLSQVEEAVSKFADGGRLNKVGISFGVIKARFGGEEVDISLPRLDNKTGQGHRGFVVDMQSDLSPEQAASRRDFTINSMYYEPITGKLIDPYMGQVDLEKQQLRPTSAAFREDVLRVLRGMQFAGRFDMVASDSLMADAYPMKKEYHLLSKERVWGEWYKWATKSVRPSVGLWLLHDCQWDDVYPEIYGLIGINQDPEWHPEGGVFNHTLLVVDAMNAICSREKIVGEDKAVLILAALCHDMGKAVTTEKIDGRWRAPKHAEAGVPIAEQFLKSIGCFQRIIDRVLPLVKEHMAHVGLDNVTKRIARRLSVRLGAATIRELGFLVEADMSGRPPLPKQQNPIMAKIVEVAEQLEVVSDKPERIVTGKHLINLGMRPGPKFGEILDRLYEEQLDGVFETLEEGILRI